MSYVRLSYENQGFSTEITNILVNSWRTGTQSRSGTYIREWSGFCTKQQIDPMQPHIIKVLEFLHSLKMRNVGYSVINTARSAFSRFIANDNHTFGMNPLVLRYLKNLFNECPVLPKYSFTWDVRVVLKYISSMNTENVQHLSQKLATLCVQRAREILSLIGIRNIPMEETCLIIRIGDLLKTSNHKFHNGELNLPKHIENTNICPVTTLKQYLHMTSKNRGEIKSLFITRLDLSNQLQRTLLLDGSRRLCLK